MPATNCCFCKDRLSNEPISAFGNLLWVKDNHPLCPDHTLLISVDHILAFSAYSDPLNFLGAINTIGDYYTGKFGGYCAYEHGNIEENQSIRPSIDHAHIHFAPTASPTAFAKLPLERLDSNPLVSGLEAARTAQYHLFFNHLGYHYFTNKTLPSQFFRRWYAESIGANTWNWKSEARPI